MRQRGFTNTATTVVLAALAALLVAPFLMHWVVVDVRTAPPDDIRIKLPVPLALVRAALWFVPADEIRDELPASVAAHREQVLAALKAVQDSPDATFLAIRSREGTVTLAKQEGKLRLDIDQDDAKVHCVLPLQATERLLTRWDWRHVDPALALDFLAEAGRGPLVSIDSEDATVRVAMW